MIAIYREAEAASRFLDTVYDNISLHLKFKLLWLRVYELNLELKYLVAVTRF